MAIHKLQLEDFDQIDYDLIAIHTTLEDYRLAFKINQQLQILLSKNEEEIPIEINKQKTSFSRFTFEDETAMMSWDLIQNKQDMELPVQTKSNSLFEDNWVTTQVNLISELKKVDYFLKIEHDEQINTKEIITKIKKIDSISTVYAIDVHEIKSKNNLIF
ncbi:IPExxxVDY family protein [Flavobacterium amniphilum]|uniref:IPExxxVDY family protein n=1 Tax=Flavobacterium amniphilum TaxID=1834035 RepID=UPI00202A461C|nr:IPExxxVDY family protein [Flavobacterium amniphilum]MCL9805987.1 IPExxxVDY family protein [Flavobacterium amniphilum]